MANEVLSRLVEALYEHVERTCRATSPPDEEQAVHDFLARHDRTPAEHFGVVDECRRRRAARLARSHDDAR